MEPINPIDPDELTDATEIGTMFSVSATFQPKTPTEKLGADLPRYERIQELGKGAMGEVWLMRDIYLRRKVASKQLLPQLDSPEVQAQFLSEAQITARLEHPGVVPVYTLEIDDEGRLSYAMKVVQGNTLKEEIAELRESQKATPNRQIWQRELFRLLDIFLKVCDALDYAHSKGIIHRDLKPANIMIGPFREVYVVDWGIAQVWNRPEVEAEEPSKVIAGTPRYLSPEQARCRHLTPASDQFTLGLILQEILTLAPAFQAKSMPEMLKKILTGNKAPCTQALGLHPIPQDLQEIVNKATALKIVDRYASVADMAADLRRYLQDVETQVNPDNLPRKILRLIRRYPQRALLGSMLLLVACSVAVAGSLFIRQQALVQTQKRKTVLEDLQRKVTITGQQLDIYLSSFEAQLEYLTGAAAESWQRGENLSVAIYTPKQLPQTSLLPSTTEIAAGAPFYWQMPVWLQDLPAFSRLISLNAVFQRVFAVAANPLGTTQNWLKNPPSQPNPLGWACVSFATGPTLVYPGSAQAEKVFQALPSDKRVAAQNLQTRPDWLGPTSILQTPYFSVSAPIRNDQRETVGRGYLWLRQAALEAELKHSPLVDGLVSFQVVDPQSQVLFAIKKTQSAAEPLPEKLKKDLAAGKSGIAETSDSLYIYQSLATSNWHLVTQVDFQMLLTQARELEDL
jgi:eukaryotic-like serine/threonine-protein kinase